MKVLAFKLTTGQEVVAEATPNYSMVSSTNVISYTMKKPHVLQLQQDRSGNVGMVFIPWTLSNPDLLSIDVPTSAIICSFEPADQVEKQYLTQTSGIDLSGVI